VLCDPDPAWPGMFRAESARLRAALGESSRRIDHIGSTSVPRLAAKPIVDIQVSVADIDDIGAYQPGIEGLGHALLWDERPIGHCCFGDRDTARRRFNVHVCQEAMPWERRHLLFRDWLRAHAGEAQAYLAAKRELAPRFTVETVNDYAESKSAWIGPATERAEAWASATGWTVPNPVG
jgi:GrpB-like predicted nucleotidyltransferase (UPF0157 family)